jgi:hypothetical protein
VVKQKLEFNETMMCDIISTHILVSPANSHGWMDGCIDKIYVDVFPDIESRVKRRIAKTSKPWAYVLSNHANKRPDK